ncbi:MAG: hypothetical protein ACLQPH_19485 [Acidimicrobiales bacterium]
MANETEGLIGRIDELERRLEAVEHQLVTRTVLDEEIQSLEFRLSELRETTEG